MPRPKAGLEEADPSLLFALSGHPEIEEADIQFRKTVQQNVLLLCRDVEVEICGLPALLQTLDPKKYLTSMWRELRKVGNRLQQKYLRRHLFKHLQCWV
jgi:hypothetical protein